MVEISPGESVHIVPLAPKIIPLGDDIPEEEEWIIPFKNDEDPDTIQDEQEWATREHKFAFNALPIS